VAEVLVKVGRVDRAEQLVDRAELLARGISDPSHRTLAWLAKAFAEVGRVDRAELMVRAITDPKDRAGTLAEVVGVLAAGGRVDRAEQMARALTDTFLQSLVLCDLAEALAEAGQVDRALEMVDRAEQVADTMSDRSRVLTDLVEVLVKLGQVDRAERLVRTISDPTFIARTVAEIVSHLDRARARRLLSWALTRSRATALLPAIAEVDPSLVLQVADEMRAALLPPSPTHAAPSDQSAVRV